MTNIEKILAKRLADLQKLRDSSDKRLVSASTKEEIRSHLRSAGIINKKGDTVDFLQK
jgi:hypothetical protein